MSSRYRNPFKIRATEKLENENNFLKMYCPYVLDELLEKNKISKLWKNILCIRSSPGAGKTSILKLFEPTSLLTLSNNNSAPYYKEILEYLRKLEVLDASGKIHLVGVYISCARNYEVIEDLEISEGQKKALFFALLNARIILSSLRSIINLNNKITLSDILFNVSSFDYSFLDFKFPVSGQELFDWAAKIEKSVFKAIDSFLPIGNTTIQGHSELFAFDLMQINNISTKLNFNIDKILFMFDDAHKLSKNQRDFLFKYLTVKRGSSNIWIAERLEALDEQKNIGSFKNRDFDEINLEEIWQGQGANKFKAIVASIADKRASMSSEDVSSFRDFLEENLKESEFEDKFNEAFQNSLQNIKSHSKFNSRFYNWLKFVEDQASLRTPLQKAILSRQVEILIHRHIGKSQLAFEFPLTTEELTQKIGGEIQTTALYFVSNEYKLPYYHGFDNLARLSSNNIEQFLSFAGDLYELMLSKKISDKSITLDASDQEKLLRKIAENKWKELNRLVPYSENVINFLHNLATFSVKETNKPNAPYAPGINGFAIKESVQYNLIKDEHWKEDKVYTLLINVLATCLSYNLLEKRTTKQGKENQQWTVFYLNRWICLRYNLPLSYGGFRHKSPSELLKWAK